MDIHFKIYLLVCVCVRVCVYKLLNLYKRDE